MNAVFKKTLILGILFFSLSMGWSTYSSFVPIFLSRFFEDHKMIDFIMMLEGFLGLFLYPVFGVLSDRKNTRFGKRLPYLLFGVPISALILTIISTSWSSWSLVILILGFNIAMISSKSPALALMADLIPDSFRSVSNGIIYFLSGLGAMVIYLWGAHLYRINETYPFLVTSSIMTISLIILYKNIIGWDCLNAINDIDQCCQYEENEDDEESEKATINLLLILAAVFFSFLGFRGIELSTVNYANYHLGFDNFLASKVLTLFSLSMVIFAIPSGFVALAIGRKWAAASGLMFVSLIFWSLNNFYGINRMMILFILSGAGFALININSYPMLLAMAGSQNLGRFTGYYYVCICLSSIISPLLVNKLIDLLGYGIFPVYTSVTFTIAFILMLAVKNPDKK